MEYILIYYDFLFVSYILISIGTGSLIINRDSVISILLAMELIFLGIIVIFLGASIHLDDILGQIYALVILTVSAAESSVGLAIFVSYHRLNSVSTVMNINTLKG